MNINISKPATEDTSLWYLIHSPPFSFSYLFFISSIDFTPSLSTPSCNLLSRKMSTAIFSLVQKKQMTMNIGPELADNRSC